MIDLDLCELEDTETKTSHAGWGTVRMVGRNTRVPAQKLANGTVEYRHMGKTRTADKITHSTFSYDCD